MRLPGRTERRLIFAILVVSVLPLMTSLYVAQTLVKKASSLFFNPDIGNELERSLSVYNDLAKAMKEALRAKADAIAAQEPLRAAALLEHTPSIEQELASAFETYPDMVHITIESRDGRVLGQRDRGRPVDQTVERTLEVRRPLADQQNAPDMVVVFAAPRARLDDIVRASEFVQSYRTLEQQRANIQLPYLFWFPGLLMITIAIQVLMISLFVRRLTRRITLLAQTTRAVGAGDLSVRVSEEGQDEIGDLARAFNRMLSEVEESRARIEFLRRMGTWQEMARRLAHEIKNPLTPIQLAVEECHRRYSGENPKFAKLLDLTMEIVAEEIGTLRHLVGEFSNFARLPRADLARADLGEFVRDQQERFAMIAEGNSEEDQEVAAGVLSGVTLQWTLGSEPIPIALDPIMLHRVLVNVISNAAEATRAADGPERTVNVSVSLERETRAAVIDIDDNGPGVSAPLRTQIFDPYFTTKTDGTGLGLAIVKKIIMEHGGSIEASSSPLGGARIRIRLPGWGTAASDAARRAGADGCRLLLTAPPPGLGPRPQRGR